jgi:hypothetical protein
LTYSTGHGRKDFQSPAALPAMIAGDIDRNGLINESDFVVIRDSASGSFNPRFMLRGLGFPSNGFERTMVDVNMNKVAALPLEIRKEYYPGTTDEESISFEMANAINMRVDQERKEFNLMKRAKFDQYSSGAGIVYKVSAVRDVVDGKYVDVDLFIENIGDV